ncbi:TlyA family RNA methyltransferase [Pseudenhygromyxa sp. WMMC2535]|uniref:TlyA family rRNA (cytidine-2'-O)-methyltransferase n=1 Tax=Pseudenhygromyxa sp. WMMC2535 TaxID=2712867 RepID=UPI001551F954|nr:TlyA family RNA methyltransferase [Pseudenhygromyxa sp. WMMC2535]
MGSERAPKRKTVRLDKLLVERGLCDSRSRAQALILAGEVVVGDHAITKAGTPVDPEAAIRFKSGAAAQNPYVSRGGLKLRAALDHFAGEGLEVAGRVCMDVGASTGGFTDCVLQAGAARVYAVDVGYGQLAWKLAQDPRVVVLDRQNIRSLAPEQVPEPISLVVADCSFISLTKVLPHLPPFLDERGAELVMLVKPQFEVGREHVGKGGIVRDDELRARALSAVEAAARALGLVVRGAIDSPIHGREGNRELLSWLSWAGNTGAREQS